MTNTPGLRFEVIALAVGLLGAACGGSDPGSTATDTGSPDAALGDAVASDSGQAELPPADEGGPETSDGGPADAPAIEDTAADLDTGPIEEPDSSPYFEYYIAADKIPGRFPPSACDALTHHHSCVSTRGCGWLRTIKDNGVCREDPVARCVDSGECECRAADFHGDLAYEADLELFVPLSILWHNLAPATSAYGGGKDRYTATLDVEPIVNESMDGFTSRTDFTHKTLTLAASEIGDLAGISEAGGLTLTLKLMKVWDQAPEAMTGVLFEGLGIQATLADDQLTLVVDGVSHPVAGANPFTGGLKDYQCNQLGLVIPAEGDATAWLGGVATTIGGLDMAHVAAHLGQGPEPLEVLRVGPAHAKIWDLRLYGQGRQLTPQEIAEIGRRCGDVGDYAIPEGYPESNARYSYGMGGYNVVQDHETQWFSSGVYVTMWVPTPDTFPPVDGAYRDDLNRMIGFWDRWHEQMFFELDMVPFTDLRELSPPGSHNTYRHYPEPLCPEGEGCGETANYANPCRYATDLFEAFNWLPEDFPGEPTSADHRKIAEKGGWTRWATHDPDLYGWWSRPVHEHGHTAHFTLMRTYERVHHYIRGIAGESFAELMSQYVLTGETPWMIQGLTYYPTIPVAFEGRWDGELERHVFKSSQPYQEKNIDDLGLGARFYGLGAWWMYVSHFQAKPYLVGRLSADSDLTPGTTLQRTRFYLAQEGLDLGELFGNFAAHVVTWDWPHIGHFYHQVEQAPFDGIAKWCTENSGPDCTVDSLKIQADVSAETGTGGEWVDSPEGLDPGGFAYSTIRVAGAAGGALYEFGLDFEVPAVLYPGTEYQIGLPSYCRDDPRLFSSRIVVVEAGTEGQEDRPKRPEYYKIPGRHVDGVIVRVPEGMTANIYLLAIPTPPFELEDVPKFVDGYSLRWPFEYKVTRLSELPEGAAPEPPIILEGDAMLELTPHTGNGFVYDCFGP